MVLVTELRVKGVVELVVGRIEDLSVAVTGRGGLITRPALLMVFVLLLLLLLLLLLESMSESVWGSSSTSTISSSPPF